LERLSRGIIYDHHDNINMFVESLIEILIMLLIVASLMIMFVIYDRMSKVHSAEQIFG